MLAFAAVVGGVSAQEPVKTLSDAQTEYDQAVIEQKRAVSEARNLERRISDAASHRLETVKADYQGVKERYKIVVAEQNMGQFAGYLRTRISGIELKQYNEVKGQPFVVADLVKEFTKMMEE